MLKEGDDVRFIDDILPEYRGKWLVLYFYPKDFTSGCTKEACSFRDRYSEIKNLDVEVVGVSVDDEETHRKFKEKYNLPFHLLSDREKRLIKMFGVENMGRARRTTFIINPERRIVKAWGRVKVENHADEIIQNLKELKK
ncbi:MAG: peroxiredoxin [Thermoplasmata archaeon]|jgi:peroxiredoxin Q/BCP|nr:peroxiredoxin [Thermoplasmatales archaeon]PMP75855.1 MAG: peroxiredoxin [Aciduliprofundum sp.]HEU13103.1 peroxiredoxin [Euryarchaeota archaeon]